MYIKYVYKTKYLKKKNEKHTYIYRCCVCMYVMCEHGFWMETAILYLFFEITFCSI